MSRFFKVARVLAQVALWAVALSLSVVLAALLFLRTDEGRGRLLGFALPRIQPVLGGRLKVGRIEGDLLHTIIVHDAEIAATDGRPVIRARRLEAHYSLASLLHGEMRIDELRGEGVWFGLHLMPDGRFNLAGLTAPTPPSPPKAHPFRFVIAHAHLESELRYDAPTMPIALRVVEAAVLVEGGLEIEGSTIRVPLEHIDGRLLPPLAAPVHAHGRLVVADGALTLEGVGVALDLDEAAFHRLLPDALMGRLSPLIDRLGPSQLELATEGVVDPIAIRVRAEFPRTAATVDAVVTLAGRGPAWTATAESPGARYSSTGQLDWQWFGPLEGSVDAAEFARLAAFGLPEIGGHVRAQAKLARSPHGNELSLDVDGTDVRYSSVRLHRLVLRAATTDEGGMADATAHGVALGPLGLERLELGARDDGRTLRASVEAHGSRQSLLSLQLRGAPIMGNSSAQGRSFSALLEHLLVDATLKAEGQSLHTTRSARVHVGQTIRVDGLALASESARVEASGFYDTAGGAKGKIGGRLVGDRIDVQQLLSLFAPGVIVPPTELHVDLRARGTVQAPIVDAAITAKTVARAGGRPAVRTAAIPSAKSPASVPPTRAAMQWTPQARSTQAAQSAQGAQRAQRAQTTQLTQLTQLTPATPATPATEAMLPAPAIPAAEAAAPVDLTRGFPATSATVSGRYAAGRVRGKLSASMVGQSLTASFAVPATSSGAGPITGRALFDLDLARLPVAALALVLPLASGHLDGSLSVGGTWHAPLIRLQARGRDLAGAHFDRVDLTLGGRGDPGSASAEADVTLRGTHLATLRAHAALAGIAPPGASVFGRWRRILDDAPVEINGVVGPYPLALVPELADHVGGVLAANLSVSGTATHPIGHASLHVDGLALGEESFDRFAADARFDGAQVNAKLDAVARGGSFVAAAQVPIAASSPWHLEAHVVDFPLDLAALPLSSIRSLKGVMNAEVTVDGTRAQPSMSGSVRARDGALGFGSSSFVYDSGLIDAAIEADAEGERLTLRKLSFSAAKGSFDASGVGRLQGLHPVAFDGLASFNRYPVALKGVNGWITAKLDLHVQTDVDGLGGTVVVRDGLAQLADLARVRSVQSTATPRGVQYFDAAGRRDAAAALVATKAAEARIAKVEARAAENPNAKPDATFTVSIPGPFRVEGKEVQASLKAELLIDRVESAPRITGVIESTDGTVELLGRRYVLEKMKVDFGGEPSPDPDLDVRITRSTDVTVVIEVQGPSSGPDVIFSSIPPVYSEEQVMAMILSGSPSATEVGSESLDDRVAGALSGTFVGQLKDQLLPILPVDVIKVDLATNSLGQEDTRFEVGKYLTESVYVSYVHQLGTVFGIRRLNRNQLQLEYRFARHFEVESSFGDNGVGALDLYWNRRF